MKKHWPCSWNIHSHTIKYRVRKIVPEGHGEGNKCHTEQWSSAARNRISIIPMCQKSTAFTSLTRAGSHGPVERHKEGASDYTWFYTTYTCSIATDRRWAMSHSNTPVIKRALLRTRSSSGVYWLPSTTLQFDSGTKIIQAYLSI